MKKQSKTGKLSYVPCEDSEQLMHVCNLVSLRFAPGYHHSVSTGPLVTHTVWVTKGPVETEDTDQTARMRS